MNSPTEATADVLARDGELAIRLMRDDDEDYEAMYRWLSDPEVLQYTYGRDHSFGLEDLRAKYRPRIRGEAPTTSCFIAVDDRPTGYMQFYRWIDWFEDARRMGLDPGESAYGIDIWIGEPALWGRGMGTRAVTTMVGYLFERREATLVALSTVTRNLRAIRCYEKAGFAKLRLLKGSEFREGKLHDEWVMVTQQPDAH